MKALATILLLAASGVAVTPAAADQLNGQPSPRVFDTPNARLQHHGQPWLSVGANHRTGVDALFVLGLGRVAEVGLGFDEMVIARERRATSTPARATYAVFRVGVEEGALSKHAPAVALGFRRTIVGQVEHVAPDTHDVEVANLDLVASKKFGPVDLHLGARVWDLRAVDGTTPTPTPIRLTGLGEQLRPMAALSWTPGLYPRTRLLLDVSSVPVLEDSGATVRVQGVWGVRYHAASWAHIELMVRHVGGQGLDDSTVFARLAVAPAAWWK